MVDFIGNNPKVDIGNNIPGPDIQTVVKKYYEYIDFTDKNFDIYDPSTFTIPANQTYYFHQIQHVINSSLDTLPFVSMDSWNNNIRVAPSGFLTSANSLMPKLIIPSQTLVDNGINLEKEGYKSIIQDGFAEFHGDEGFNWNIDQVAGETAVTDAIITQTCAIGGEKVYGKKYICVNAKDDSSNNYDTTITLPNSTSHPKSDAWEPKNLVADGAFVLTFNITPVSSNRNVSDQAGKKWSLTISMGGSINIHINDTGAANIEFLAGDISRAQLMEAKSKEKSPQAEIMEKAYVLVVYPVWNGIVVASGVQDIKNNVKISSQYCIKDRNINLLNYSKTPEQGFTTEEPTPVLIDDFNAFISSPIIVSANNCKFQMAYSPIFFLPRMKVDHYFIGQISNPSINATYRYKAYPIWSRNGTNYELNGGYGSSTGISATLTSINDPNLPDDVGWYKLTLDLNNGNSSLSDGKCNRYAPEIFGYILETTETKRPDVRNNNGNFAVATLKSGTPAGPNPSLTNWKEYIKSINIQLGLDGSSGQIVVDKYGLAGQNALPKQSIGAVTIDVKGPGTNGYEPLFKGLGVGIGDSRSIDGGDWTVPLFGLEKKLSDIVLINVPFFDGYRVISSSSNSVLGYLCLYGGINWDWKDISLSERLPSSTDIQAPLVDFKTGTSVMDAINQVMDLTACSWTILDGKINFYKLSTDGLPITLGVNWATQYPDTKVISIDRNPDFEDLRNEVITMGLQQIDVSNQDNPDLEVPILPLVKVYDQYNLTDPKIEWAKPLVYGVPGYVNEEKLDSIYSQIRKLTTKYEMVGRTSIPGNALIRPYDQWNVDSNEKFVIISVNHSIDLQGKTWTTDLEFASGR